MNRSIIKKFQSIILCLSSIIFSESLIAGESHGKVGAMYINEDLLFFYIVGGRANVPQCNTTFEEWGVRLDTKGKAMYAMLLTAKSQNIAVHVTGYGDCRDQPDREAPSQIWME